MTNILTGGLHKVNSLQCLRGLAAGLVLFIHCGQTMRDTAMHLPQTPYNITLLGEIGVDIFFVISGAIMTIILARKPLLPLVFLKKRCIRILPLYWMLSLAMYVYIVIIRHGSESYLSVLKTITILPIFDQPNKGIVYYEGIGNFPLLTAGWTLAFEFWFYIVVAFSLFFYRKNTFLLANFLLMLSVGCGFLLNTKVLQLNFICNPLIIEFVLGSICGWLYINNFKLNKAVCYVLLATSILIIGANIYGIVKCGTNYFLFPSSGLKQMLNYGVASFFLVLSLLQLEKNKLFKAKSIFLWLGDISYSTYLMHLPVMAVLAKYYQKLNFTNAYFFMGFSIVVSILAGHLIFIFLEKPLIRFCHNFFEKPKAALATLDPFKL